VEQSCALLDICLRVQDGLQLDMVGTGVSSTTLAPGPHLKTVYRFASAAYCCAVYSSSFCNSQQLPQYSTVPG